jgi:cell division protease FtsH
LNDTIKNVILWSVIALVLVSVFSNFNTRTKPTSLSYSEFIYEVKNGRISDVAIDGHTIKGKMASGSDFSVVIPPGITDLDLMPDLRDNNVKVRGEAPEQRGLLMQLFIASFPILLIILVFSFFMRQMEKAKRV